MTRAKHFHFVYSLKLLQKGLIFCLIPLARALLNFDLASLYTALQQELALVLFLALASWLVWQRGGWQLTEQGLELRSGVLVRRIRTLTPGQIAVVELNRTVPLRLFGATRVTVYLAKGSSLPKASFYLHKDEAEQLAEQLMPATGAQSFFRPAGAQKLGLVMLSANLATTAALAWITVQQTRITVGEVLPGDWQAWSDATLHNLSQIERLVELVLPTGIAWLFTALLVLSCLSFVVSCLRTARYSVARRGGVLLSRGGLLTLSQRRIRASAVTVCDVRTTLAARLLRRYPVFLAAGSYNGGDIPILVYRHGQEKLLEQLMPEFRIPRPGDRSTDTRGRSIPAFLAFPGSLLLAAWVLFCVSDWQLPQLSPFLLVLVLVLLVLVLVNAQAYRIEDAWRGKSGVLTVRYARGFTLHSVCVFTPDVSFGTYQTPFSEARGRCTLRLRMPFHRLVRVRSIQMARVRSLAAPLF